MTPTCTDKLCERDAEFAYWMGDDFSRIVEPERDDLEPGDICPFLCSTCRERRIRRAGLEGERFVRPEEKLVTDGGRATPEHRVNHSQQCPECGDERWRAAAPCPWCPQCGWSECL